MSTTLEFYSLQSGDSEPAIDSVTVELTSTAGVRSTTATAFALSRVVPNPTRDASQLEFTVPRKSPVRLSISDVSGREVVVLRDDIFAPDRYSLAWDGRTRAAHRSADRRAAMKTRPCADRIVLGWPLMRSSERRDWT